MKTTKAQDELLEMLENGFEVTLKNDYYTIVDGSGKKQGRVWPGTFGGLFNHGALKRLENGNYTISEAGRTLLRQANASV